MKMLVLSVAILLLAGGVLLYWKQDSLIYFPQPYPPAQRDLFRSAGGIEIPFAVAHGSQLGFLVPARSGEMPRRIWFCFSGNGGLALNWLGFARQHQNEPDVAFFLIDWPGYGASEGTPRPETLVASVEGAVSALALHYDAPETEVRSRIAVLGHSMGAAAALLAGNEVGAKRAILFAPYTSLQSMANHLYGPVGFLLRHNYDNEQELENFVGRKDAEVLIFHGTEDEVVPVKMGRTLNELGGEPVRLIELEGEDHNSLFDAAAAYLKRYEF